MKEQSQRREFNGAFYAAFSALEVLLLFLLPSNYYVQTSCWSRSPPACSFHFRPSLEFFLLVSLPFLALIALGLLLKWKDRVVIFSASWATVLVGVFLLGLTDASPAVLAVAILPALLLNDEGKVSSAVSLVVLIAVYALAKMGMARAI